MNEDELRAELHGIKTRIVDARFNALFGILAVAAVAVGLIGVVGTIEINHHVAEAKEHKQAVKDIRHEVEILVKDIRPDNIIDQAVFASAAAELLSSPATERSPEDWNSTAQMDEFMQLVGYTPFFDESGELQDLGSETENVDLQAGYEYRFLGVCDDDCVDLDLTLRSGNELLQTDALPDSLPIVDHSPPASGQFGLVVSMAACADTTGCQWRVRGFRTRTEQ